MTAPPGLTPDQQPDLGANHEGQRSDGFLSVATIARQAAHIVEELRLPISGSRLRKLVRAFVTEGNTSAELRVYLLHYSDPTGEQAVRNIMRARA